MDATIINPFLESVHELFSTMLNAQVHRKKLLLCGSPIQPNTIVALVGLSGAVRGTVALSLPRASALAMVGALLSSGPEEAEESLCDGTAELVNIFAGSAKARLPRPVGGTIDLSLPAVLEGGNFSIQYQKQTAWIEIPFDSGLGPFSICIAMENQGTKPG